MAQQVLHHYKTYAAVVSWDTNLRNNIFLKNMSPPFPLQPITNKSFSLNQKTKQTMKKKLFLLSIAATLICSLSFATIRRVGFFGPAVSGVDYTTLQLAHDAATAGDTIMMQPGASMSCTITKGLVIIGPGYFLNPSDVTYPGNVGLQASLNSTSPGSLNFNTGSSNTQIIGCYINSGAYFNQSGVSNILFKRCLIGFEPQSNSFSLYFNANMNLITFQQCVIWGIIRTLSGSITNLSYLNCFFECSENSYITSSGLMNNCVFVGSNTNTLGSGAWQVSNCISQASFSGTNVIYNNNIGTSTQFPAGNGNQQSKPWNTIFTLTGSYDGKYALKAGSPAIGAGINGASATDCGIFGGATPYRLSGIPSVPTIYSLTSPQGTIPAGNTVQINLSTRSNN